MPRDQISIYFLLKPCSTCREHYKGEKGRVQPKKANYYSLKGEFTSTDSPKSMILMQGELPS